MSAILTVLYGLTSTILLVGYLPQALSVWKSRNGARDVSLSTWFLWALSSAIAALYAFFVIQDVPYLVLSLGNVTGCTCVVGLVIWRRARRRAAAQARRAAQQAA